MHRRLTAEVLPVRKRQDRLHDNEQEHKEEAVEMPRFFIVTKTLDRIGQLSVRREQVCGDWLRLRVRAP